MKRLAFWLAVFGIVGVAGAAGYSRLHASRAGGGPFRTQPIRRGDITLTVNSTGTVQPVQSVQVGAFVSGPILKVFVDFNAKVKKDQLLAQIDPRTYKSAVAREEASLAHGQADLARVKALLDQAVRNERRALRLKASNSIAETDLDQSITDRKSLDAQIKLGEASIQQCAADLETARTNLDFTYIKSPVDGIVIDRKVDPGQTVAAQFQTPVLFIVAPDLEKKVYVYASVDEADIGLTRDAQRRDEPVTFTVDAYPDDSFEGRIAQIRLNPSTVSNVVTYTVVVESANAQLKLLPGMTANLAFRIQRHTGVLVVPNAALRFRPKAEQVRASDRAILDGSDDGAATTDRGRNRHYVWILDGGQLSAVDVVTGLSDKTSTELVSGNLTEGQQVITGSTTPTAKAPSGPPPPPM
jgi:HlyD family secretion protein